MCQAHKFLFFLSNLLFTAVIGDNPGINEFTPLLHSPPSTAAEGFVAFYQPSFILIIGSAFLIALMTFLAARKTQPQSIVGTLFSTFGIGLALCYWAVIYPSGLMMKSYPLEPVSNSIRILGFYATENIYYGSIERDMISKKARKDKPTDNIVFVIDESVRYDAISMNNKEVATTPFIDGLKNLKNMGMVVSVGTASFNADVDGQQGLQELAGNATLLYYLTEEGEEGRKAWNEKRAPDYKKYPWLP